MRAINCCVRLTGSEMADNNEGKYKHKESRKTGKNSSPKDKYWIH